jgi:lysophospholipase L1-like esterase
MKIGFLLLFALLICACTKSIEKKVAIPDDPAFVYSGRFDFTDSTKPVFMYSGCAIKVNFTGTSVQLLLKDDNLRNFFTVILDDSLFVLASDRADSTYQLADSLPDKQHTLEIIRRSEWSGGNSTFQGLRIDGKARLVMPALNEHKIEFIGDSYTCGYGNEGLSQTENFRYETENNYLSFGAITAREVGADYVAVCRSGIGMVQGYGGLRDFNMPKYYDEVINAGDVKWDYSHYQPDLVFIDLIANDLSAPLDSAEFVNTYLNFLKRIRSNYSDAMIVCAAGPSSPGKEWNTIRSYIHTIVDAFGISDQKIRYFEFKPFVPSGSDWHPNIAEHKKMAEELIPFVKNLMNW